MERIKIVVVGDPGAGKTSLIRRFVEDTFDPSYNPTIYDKYEKIISYKGKKCILVVEDTAGQAEYARLRAMQYTGANIVVLCFALADNQYTHSKFHELKKQLLRGHTCNVGFMTAFCCKQLFCAAIF